MTSRPSHQRRPDTFRADLGTLGFLYHSTRPITHAVIASRMDPSGDVRPVAFWYTSAELAGAAVVRKMADPAIIGVPQVVEAIAPWTTFGRPQMTGTELAAWYKARELAGAAPADPMTERWRVADHLGDFYEGRGE